VVSYLVNLQLIHKGEGIMSTQYRDLADYITTRARQLEHNTLSLSEALGYG